MENYQADVLISGAGPTGLMLGCLLQHAGVKTNIIEKLSAITTEIRGLMLHAKSLELLEQLDIVNEVIAAGIVVPKLAFHVIGGRDFTFSFSELKTKYPYYVIIPQPKLEELMENKYKMLGGAIKRGQSLESFVQLDRGVNSSIQVIEGEKYTVYTRFLVGCDGARSHIRDQLNITFDGHTYPMKYVLAEGYLECSLPRDEASMYISSNGIISVLPLPNGQFRIAGPGLGNDEEQLENNGVSEAQFHKILEKMGVLDFLKFKDFSRTAFYSVNERWVAKMQSNYVFLAGDAAHIHSPAGGQAINRGFLDAYNLSIKLGGYIFGAIKFSALSKYHEECAPVDREIMQVANFFSFIQSMRQARSIHEVNAVETQGNQLVKKLSLLHVNYAKEVS
jgi:2-polyprenyl-6-methoxyphenol hydroxylase-like FAD-dependent oxidoreductase